MGPVQSLYAVRADHDVFIEFHGVSAVLSVPAERIGMHGNDLNAP